MSKERRARCSEPEPDAVRDQPRARLRELLSDRLFERHGTALVENLAQPLNETLRSLEQVVNSGNHFEPSAAARCFVIGMDERLELFALPSFIERMVKIAPNLDLASVPFDPRAARRSRDSGFRYGTTRPPSTSR
jgi:DNA-binding transcriptional LysR family regulator